MSYNFSDSDQREAAMAAKWAECCEENTSLRQQLAELKSELKAIGAALDDPRTDLTMTMSEVIIDQKKQLAATADLKDVILCHAVPAGWCGTSGVGELIVSKSKVWNFLTTPLYRAWEPK